MAYVNEPQYPQTRAIASGSASALPELAEFWPRCTCIFTQGPSAETLGQYLTGLLSEHPNKNCDTLTEIVPETNEQQFNHLLTDMVWDETVLNRQRIARMQTLPSEGDGVLILMIRGLRKRGRHEAFGIWNASTISNG
jgi:SRSO17 transposase